MARRRLWRNHVVSLYWRTRHPLLRFLCLHEAVILPFVVAIFWPKPTFCDHLHFGDCLSGTLFSSRWSAMEYRRCQTAVPRVSSLAKTLTVSALSAWVFRMHVTRFTGPSKCKICEGFPSHNPPLSACEKESSIFPRRAPGTSAASRRSRPLVKPTTWGSDVELEEMGEWADRPRLFSPEQRAREFSQLNLCMIFYFLARGHVIPFPSG